MTITPLAPRTPYNAKPAGSCTTSIDAISCGLMALRLAPCSMSTGTSSTIHRGWLFDIKEVTPWMRTERPPSDLSVTVTPGKRSLKSCASDRPGARSISSDVITEWGTALAGSTSPARPSPVAFFWWEQAVAKPRSEEHTSELQSRVELVCRLLLEKKKKLIIDGTTSQNKNEKNGVAIIGYGPHRQIKRYNTHRADLGSLHLRFFFLMLRPPRRSTLFPYTPLFR